MEAQDKSNEGELVEDDKVQTPTEWIDSLDEEDTTLVVETLAGIDPTMDGLNSDQRDLLVKAREVWNEAV